jgi:hypothetical protein
VVTRAAKDLVRERLLLQEDADRLIADAAASHILSSDSENQTAKRLCKELRGDHGHHQGQDYGHDKD